MRARFVSSLKDRRKSAILWARQWRAVRGVVMNRIKLSIRVPAAQEMMLRHIAEVDELPVLGGEVVQPAAGVQFVEERVQGGVERR